MRTPNTWVCAFISVLIIASGCKKPETSPKNGCKNAGKTVLNVSSEVGRIMYHEDNDIYYLSYHIPKTIDVDLTGIICNMPSDFPRPKDYTEVVFSGLFKAMENDSGILGWDRYYLELTDIRIKEENQL